MKILVLVMMLSFPSGNNFYPPTYKILNDKTDVLSARYEWELNLPRFSVGDKDISPNDILKTYILYEVDFDSGVITEIDTQTDLPDAFIIMNATDCRVQMR